MNKNKKHFILFAFLSIFLTGCVNTTTYSSSMYGDNPVTATENKKNKKQKDVKFSDVTPIY